MLKYVFPRWTPLVHFFCTKKLSGCTHSIRSPSYSHSRPQITRMTNMTSAWGYENILMHNSMKHEIYPGNKCQTTNNCSFFSCLRMQEFIVPINIKMPTNVGILIFIIRINSCSIEVSITSGPVTAEDSLPELMFPNHIKSNRDS